jgi:sulfite exporter TauE/SafE
VTLLAVFLFGLVSGLHCVQMCGPIVLVIGPRRGDQFAYHCGRILTYMALGALAGAAGGGLGLLGRLAGLASAARIVSGAAMILAGIAMLGFLRKPELIAIRPAGFTRRAGRLLAAPRGKFAVGLLLGFLPCGLIYAALLKALDAATAPAGALTMLAFGLGTAAALLALGFAAGFAGPWINRVAPVAVMLTGALLLWRAFAASPICHGGPALLTPVRREAREKAVDTRRERNKVDTALSRAAVEGV